MAVLQPVFYAASVALICSVIGTGVAIRLFMKLGFGQEVRLDGLQTHLIKQGTPTMGGTVIVLSTLIGYFAAKVLSGEAPSASALLVLLLMVGMGAVGFVDDVIKTRSSRSLGLRGRQKLVGQSITTIAFAVPALHFRNALGLTPASDHISSIRDLGWLGLGPIVFVVWCYVMTAGWSNAVNITDGQDGLAAGASVLAFGAYVVIGIWQSVQACGVAHASGCYEVRDPLDLAIVAASVVAACLGFLWWNAAPAKIFMGDTGSLALGGAFAGLAICTRTELLSVIIGGLFVMELMSVVVQVGSFKLRHGKRVFKIAPVHHHFEMVGWAEPVVTVRFWIVAALCAAAGLAVLFGGSSA